MTIREKEAAALELLVQAAQVEEGRDGSVTVSGWRGVAEGSAHRAVVRVNLVGEVGLFPHLCNRIGIDWIKEIPNNAKEQDLKSFILELDSAEKGEILAKETNFFNHDKRYKRVGIE